jgi:hypothetical protein
MVSQEDVQLKNYVNDVATQSVIKNKITEFISWFQTVDKLDEKSVCLQLFYLKVQLISEIRSLSADCLPSLLSASACGVSASQ